MNALLCGYNIQPLSKRQEWKPETGVRRIRATSLGTVLKTYVCLVHTYSPGLQRWLCRFGDFAVSLQFADLGISILSMH